MRLGTKELLVGLAAALIAVSSAYGARGDHPIVYLHGALGYGKRGPLEYFAGVRDVVGRDGKRAFMTEVSPLHRTRARALQLAPQLDKILAETGAAKVHLVGHSQGGLDARYLVSSLGYGDRVASVTTIGTPHQGVAFARSLYAKIARRLQGPKLSYDHPALRAKLRGLLYNIGPGYMARFNAHNPDDPRVSYYSIAGRAQANPFRLLGKDVVNPIMLATYLYARRHEGPNDGAVSERSAQWGEFLGTIPADHLDEVGQSLGWKPRRFDAQAFHLELARFLTDPAAPPPSALARR